jgi:hypothetical protein
MRNEGFYTWAAEFDKATEARRQARNRAAKAGAKVWGSKGLYNGDLSLTLFLEAGAEARRRARKHAPKAGATQRIPDHRKSKLARIEKKERKHEHET